MRDLPKAAASLAVAALCATPFARRAAADETYVSASSTTSLLYNGDNRSVAKDQVGSVVDDDWGAGYEHLTLQGGWKQFRAQLRVDGAYFYLSPSPADVALKLVGERTPGASTESDAVYFRRVLNQTGIELSNRYIHWFYPTKYAVSHQGSRHELTVGDFYAELGRGLVLSVRKQDEVATDTSIRGVRALWRAGGAGGPRVRALLLGGSMNPLRIDETSGRYLGTTGEARPGYLAVTEAGMPTSVSTDFVPRPTAAYAPDSVAGAQLTLSMNSLTLATQASLLQRQEPLGLDQSRASRRVLTASQSLHMPALAEVVDAYFEGAVQYHDSSRALGYDLLGFGLYAAVSYTAKRFTVVAEGKHYRGIYPLRANIDLGSAREFSAVQYSVPPNTLPVWADYELGDFNTCTTGGRTRGDLPITQNFAVFAWVGYYQSWAESVSNLACVTSRENRNQAWDLAVGPRGRWAGGDGHAEATLGTRIDRADRLIALTNGNSTHDFYRENYLRYDLVHPLAKKYAIQFQGRARLRRQTLGGPDGPWAEGENAIALTWPWALTTSVGIEYDTSPLSPRTYLHGLVHWRMSSSNSLALFVGQRRGAMRCVAGVCRRYPPFEGARLDLTVQF